MIEVKRIYERPNEDDGRRVLVDRLWPRGMSKKSANVDHWMKEVAPSNGLRKWFGHRRERWEEFKRRYFEELKGQKDMLKKLKDMQKDRKVTLLFGAKDKEKNNAVALCEFLKKMK